jgi:hypothetical protein
MNIRIKIIQRNFWSIAVATIPNAPPIIIDGTVITTKNKNPSLKEQNPVKKELMIETTNGTTSNIDRLFKRVTRLGFELSVFALNDDKI